MRKGLFVAIVALCVGACMEDTHASKACESASSLSECAACCKRNGATGAAYRQKGATKRLCMCTI